MNETEIGTVGEENFPPAEVIDKLDRKFLNALFHNGTVGVSENGAAYLIDFDCLRIIADRTTLEIVGWYRPDIDPEIEELKAKITKMKRHMEHIMKHPENHCVFCAYRDADCPADCDPEYMGAWGRD